MSITGSNNQFSCSPAIYTATNTIIALGTITRSGNAFTFSVGFVWKINGTIYQNNAPVTITVASATTGYYRIDNAILNTSNSIELQQGLPSNSVALQPVVPETAVLLTSWNISGPTVSDQTEPIVGATFVKKSFADYLISNDSGVAGVPATIALDASGKTEIRLINPALEEIASVNINSITNVSNPELPYSGKPYLIRNLTGNPITIIHDAALDIPGGLRRRIFAFSLKEATDLVVPNNEAVLFHFTDGFMVEIFRSWSEVDLSQKADLVGGKVPADQLPSYVDDVLEFAGLDAFPDPGETGKIYLSLETNKTYRWSGSSYIEISNQDPLWGGIGGDITSQVDLMALINSRNSPCLKLGSGAILSNFKNLFSTQSGSRLTNSLDLSPFVPEYNFTSSNLVFNIASSAAGANCRLVVYSHDTSTGLPNYRIFESVDQSVSGTGVRSVPCVIYFEVGKAYWLGLVCSSATPTFTSVPAASQNFIGINILGGSFSGYTFLQKTISAYNNTPLVYGTTHTKALSIFPIIGIQIQ